MKLLCPHCEIEFEPSKEQIDFIESSNRKEMPFIILECSSCETTFPYDTSQVDTKEKKNIEKLFRTPVAGSTGFITVIKMGSVKFFGCSETGAMWSDFKKLQKDVDTIIKKYPHRAGSYKKVSGVWSHNQSEANDIENLIKGEKQSNP